MRLLIVLLLSAIFYILIFYQRVYKYCLLGLILNILKSGISTTSGYLVSAIFYPLEYSLGVFISIGFVLFILIILINANIYMSDSDNCL